MAEDDDDRKETTPDAEHRSEGRGRDEAERDREGWRYDDEIPTGTFRIPRL